MIWPIHPQPQPDELLSSWMIRLAQNNGYKIHNFYAQFFGREHQIWNRDIDHHAPTWLLQGLASHTGLSDKQIFKMTLRSYESIVFERFSEDGATKHLLPLGIFHRIRRAYGQQFCPLCLASDAEPYLRRRWRLALAVICVEHAVLLQDQCPTCGYPLAPHRADIGAKHSFPTRGVNMGSCIFCRKKLTVYPIAASARDIKMQCAIDSALHDGFVRISSDIGIYSHLYFEGIRVLMVGLVRLGYGENRDKRVAIEHCRISTRLSLLRGAFELTVDWPKNFLEFCGTIRQPYTTFARDNDELPYWLCKVLRERLLKLDRSSGQRRSFLRARHSSQI